MKTKQHSRQIRNIVVAKFKLNIIPHFETGVHCKSGIVDELQKEEL